MLRINRLRVEINTVNGVYGIDESFNEGLNFVASKENTCGKSSILAAIYYCLGLEQILGGVAGIGGKVLTSAFKNVIDDNGTSWNVTESGAYLEISNGTETITIYRNIKAENNIDKTAVVKLNNDEDYSLIVKILKLNISKENLKINKYNVANSKYNVDIYFEKEETEADLIEKQKQIETLKNSISRREKLLSNEGYINKAPAKIVDEERKKLEEEKITLESLIK